MTVEKKRSKEKILLDLIRIMVRVIITEAIDNEYDKYNTPWTDFERKYLKTRIEFYNEHLDDGRVTLEEKENLLEFLDDLIENKDHPMKMMIVNFVLEEFHTIKMYMENPRFEQDTLNILKREPSTNLYKFFINNNLIKYEGD